MAAVTNTTSTSTLSSTMQTYYDRKLLQDMKPKLVHYQFGQKRPLPKNNGKTINFRKWTPFAANTTALSEGTPPDGQALSMTNLSTTIAQYGDYVKVTDLLDMTALDPVINDATELMADQAALSVDTIVKNAIIAGTTVQYAGGNTARNTLDATDVLTTSEIRKAVRTLKKNKARPFTDGKPYYVAIVGPDTVYDLQNDSMWQDVSKYQNDEAIYSGEIGRMFGVRFIETTEAAIVAGAGAAIGSGSDKYDVALTLVFGQDAFGVVEIGGQSQQNGQIIVKPAGSAGAADPLNQVSTVGWKVPGFAAVILQQAWIVRIEHGFSA